MKRLITVFGIFSISRILGSGALSASVPRRASIVTGANGYLGREIVHVLLTSSPDDIDQEVFCLVRPGRVSEEESYWSKKSKGGCVKVMSYDMLDGGESLSKALKSASRCSEDTDNLDCCVYHVASVFGPTDDHVQTALDNVRGTEDVVKAVAKHPGCKLVVTSSMAAVRGSGQPPANGESYTHLDWNVLSKLGDNWGSSYQWSKAESERRGWELSKEFNVPMVSLCPSFVFGPPSDGKMSNSYSIELVRQWVLGQSPVQSRLCVDVRDVANAHVAAGTNPVAINNRYILSSEARVPSQDMAKALKRVAKETGLGDANEISFDADFDGGAIKIGDREVIATERLEQDFGLVLRSVEETMADMGRALLQMSPRRKRLQPQFQVNERDYLGETS